MYRHFLGVTGADADGTWLVSGNPFDVIGAHAVGWRTAWVRWDAAAHRLRRRHRGYGDTLFIDEVFVRIHGRQRYL